MGNSDSRKKAAAMRQHQIRSKTSAASRVDTPRQFVVDVMLGRLAKWLRIAGFDVLYSNRFDDDELVELSLAEGRILLSRDTRLLVRKAVKQFIFLESEQVQFQMKQVFETAGIKALPDILTRCLHCNDLLADASRESVKDKVPPYVFEHQSHFKTCPKCGKIFWAGTHRQSVLRTLEKLLRQEYYPCSPTHKNSKS